MMVRALSGGRRAVGGRMHYVNGRALGAHGHVGRTMPNAYSRAAKAHHIDENEGIRLQKLLAQAGFGSRRKCEEMITDGRVEIDGELVTELGTRVDPKRQQVRVDGSRVRVDPNHVTLALNKPRRVLSAMDDPKGRYTLADIVGDKYDRIFHMGRLDYESEGLILMTNDGELRVSLPKVI